MSKFYKVLLWITSVASLLCLALVIWSVAHLGWHAVESKTWRETIDVELKAEQQGSQAVPVGAGATTPLTAEQKVELQQSVAGARALLLAEIHAADADERAILDRLITLVGVFSAILGLCAFATVRLAREDALAQQKRIETELDSFKTNAKTDLDTFKNTATAETANALVKTQKDLELLTASTETKIEDFRKQIWSELPEMRNLKDSLRGLMLELERTIPNVADWNEAGAYESLSGAARESILIAESTMNALQIFVSRDSQANVAMQAGLYRSLARFYFGRYRAESVDADAQRADIYARKAGEMEPHNPATDRVRGAIYLGQYRIVKKAAGQAPTTKDVERMDALLTAASGFLKDAMKSDPADAGAALNLALAARYRENFDEAIRISNDAIGNRDKMNSLQVQKYLPSLYLNVACYLARRADRQTDADAQNNGRKEAVKVLSDGMEYLESRKNSEGVTALREMITRELRRQDAFKNLGKENLDAVDALASVKRQTGGSAGGTQPGNSTTATP